MSEVWNGGDQIDKSERAEKSMQEYRNDTLWGEF